MNVISWFNAGKRQYGDSHWFWAVWIDVCNIDEWNKSEPTQCGFCTTESAARSPAWAALGGQPAYQRGWARDHLWQEEAKDERPYFSRCKVGNKWFWVVYAHDDVFNDGEPLAHGLSDSPEAAFDDAATSAGRPVAMSGNHFAESYRKRLSALKRSQALSNTTCASQIEFVYECHRDFSDYDGHSYDSVTPHRIVKKTKKRLYIEREAHRGNHNPSGTWHDFIESTFILDREEFEKTGKAKGTSRWHNEFYADPVVYFAECKSMAHRPDCLVGLGVPAGASIDEVESAYRRLARQTHPDVGGDAEAFKQVQKWYEQAVALAY